MERGWRIVRETYLRHEKKLFDKFNVFVIYVYIL